MVFDDSKLQNSVKTHQLKPEAFDKNEFDGLVKLGKDRLTDIHTVNLSYASRFDLAYNAAHVLALAALRFRGYRSDKRFFVFQVLVHVLDVTAAEARIFSDCHNRRNVAEYEGHMEENEQLLDDLIANTDKLLALVENLLSK